MNFYFFNFYNTLTLLTLFDQYASTEPPENLRFLSTIILCLLIFGWLDMEFVGNIVNSILTQSTSSTIVLGISIIFILLSVKCIFFDSGSKKEIEEAQGVLLENENGKLMISRETIQNLVNSVVVDFPSAEQVSTKIELDKENNVKVFVNLTVSSEAVIKDLSANIQAKIKEKIKNATDLEVKEVNIKIKNVAPKNDVENN